MEKENISSRFEFIFQPFTESNELENETRALVKEKDGYMQFAIWYNGTWYDEGSICYSGGIGGELSNIVEFALNGC